MAISQFPPGFVSAAQLNALVDAVNAVSADTGWQSVTNVSSTYTAAALSYRVLGKLLILRGSLTRNTGSVTVGETVFGLPAGTFPTSSNLWRVGFQSNGTVSGTLAMSASGLFTVAQVTGTTSGITLIQNNPPLD